MVGADVVIIFVTLFVIGSVVVVVFLMSRIVGSILLVIFCDAVSAVFEIGSVIFIGFSVVTVVLVVLFLVVAVGGVCGSLPVVTKRLVTPISV